MIKITALLFLFVLSHQPSNVLTQLQDTEVEECDIVITDDYIYQAEECLNLQNSTITPPPPVVLESTIDNDDFICKNKPTLYTFSCTLYGTDLIWYFNRMTVTAFQDYDQLGRVFSMSYPQSSPVYNVTAMLTLISNETLSRYNVPFCVSILTVQSFNESQTDAPVIPFNVSCVTHCESEGRPEICQVKTYQVAETPTEPQEFTGTIQNISDESVDAKAIASLDWSLPLNDNETTIDYFDITLMGTHTNSTVSVRVTDQSQQMLTYKWVLSEGNYTAASITAVDLCGQRNEPFLIELVTASISNPITDISDTITIMQSGANTTGLTAGVAVMTVVACVSLSVIITMIAAIIWCRYCPQKFVTVSDQGDIDLSGIALASESNIDNS